MGRFRSQQLWESKAFNSETRRVKGLQADTTARTTVSQATRTARIHASRKAQDTGHGQIFFELALSHVAVADSSWPNFDAQPG